MAKTTSFSLGESHDRFIAAQIESGRYGTASEVIRAGLRELERAEARDRRIRALFDHAEVVEPDAEELEVIADIERRRAAGEPEVFYTTEEVLERLDAKYLEASRS